MDDIIRLNNAICLNYEAAIDNGGDYSRIHCRSRNYTCPSDPPDNAAPSNYYVLHHRSRTSR